MRGWWRQPTSGKARSMAARPMTDACRIIVNQADPRAPPTLALIEELDRHLSQLYPAESNYLMDLDALCAPDVRFFSVFMERKLP
jgi:hypothetical protein